jgi:hypothetical protein
VKLSENTITFKCDGHFWRDVQSGVKTAEVRLLSRDEWSEVVIESPQIMHLVDLDSGMTLTKRIGYIRSVGEIVGNKLVLFCFSPEETV